MKKINVILLFSLLFVSYNTRSTAQNLNNMPVAQRDSFLIASAKEAILLLGPDYYREYKQPEIVYRKMPPADSIGDKRFVSNANRYYYSVIYRYNPEEEILNMDYAARVDIWADNGKLDVVAFGCNLAYGPLENRDWRNENLKQIPYRQYNVQPEYPLDTTDPNPEPVNKALLIRLGFEKSSDGTWKKVRPDIPPHKRVKK